MMSMQVDQIKQNRIRWNNNYLNPNSEEYVTLEDEAVYAVHKHTHFLKTLFFVKSKCDKQNSVKSKFFIVIFLD